MSVKISDLPAKGSALASTDLIEIAQVSGGSYISKRITGQNIIDAASGGSQDLQQVTDLGATTTNAISIVDSDITPDVYSVISPGGLEARDLTNEEVTNILANAIEILKTGSSARGGVFKISNIALGRFVTLEFPNKTTGSYTIATTEDLSDLQSKAVVVSTNQTAVNDASYTVVANSTFTDPSPVEGKGYRVFVRNGTATINAVAYTVGTSIFRVFHSGAWVSYVSLPDSSFVANSSSAILSTLGFFVNNRTTDTTAVTGTTTETIIDSVLIPANTYSASGGILRLYNAKVSKTGTAGTLRVKIYVGPNAGNLTGATLLADSGSLANTIVYTEMLRTFTVGSATLKGIGSGVIVLSDVISSNSARASIAWDPSIDNYIHYTVINGSAADSTVMIGNSVKNF
jgi:hypothetical protein